MGDYDQYISRTDASSYLLPDQYSKEIIQALPTSSFCLRMMRKLPNMNAKTYKIPVLNSFAAAYFVGEVAGSRDGTNTKKTTDLSWTGVDLTAEELAVIVPVPESVLQDMASGGYDLWGEVKPRLLEAIGAKIDSAILFDNSGSIAPSSWPDGIVTQAISASNYIDESDSVGDGKTFPDMADAILANGGLFSLVEQDGFIVNGAMGAISMMGKLRGLRASDGQFLFMNDMKQPNDYRLAGVPLTFPNNGAFNASTASLVVGDWSQAVYAIRQDITFKIATEASIHDASGNLVYNLFQDDMVALRVTMRMGWALPNPKNLVNGSTQFPFAVLKP